MDHALEQARALIRQIPDYPIPGVSFQDLTPLLSHGPSFHVVVSKLLPFAQSCDIVAGVEARGFIFAAAIAHALELGFVPIRKKGKLPFDTHEESYGLEYGSDVIAIHQDAISVGAKVLLVDDVLATGGTVCAGVRLINRSGGDVHAVATVLEISSLEARKRIADEFPEVPVHSIFCM
jgi:adenine phosphoribosyltransferase